MFDFDDEVLDCLETDDSEALRKVEEERRAEEAAEAARKAEEERKAEEAADAARKPSPAPEELVAKAVEGLSAAAFNVRRDACKQLAELGAAAAPHVGLLKKVSEEDEDYEVKKAAKSALTALRAVGVRPPPSAEEAAAEATAGAAGAAGGAGPPEASTDTAAAWAPTAHFQVFKEVLPMRLDQCDMTPAQIAEVWETRWGVQYASRVRFSAEPGDDAKRKWLRRDEVVPRSPFVVKLECGAGSILYALHTAMRLYGNLSPEETAAEQLRRQQDSLEAGEHRMEADLRELERMAQKDGRRRRKSTEDENPRRPWLESRPLAPAAGSAAHLMAVSKKLGVEAFEEEEG